MLAHPFKLNKKRYVYYCFNIVSDTYIDNMLGFEVHDKIDEFIDIEVVEREIIFDKEKYIKYTNEYAEFYFNEVEMVVQDMEKRMYKVSGGMIEYSLKPKCGVEIPEVCFMFAARNNNKIILHGASVVIGGKAYLFMGDSGVGKSTFVTTVLSLEEKAILISDDVLCVDEDGRYIYAGYDEIALNKDSFDRMANIVGKVNEVGKYQFKARNNNVLRKIPIGGYYFLEKSNCFKQEKIDNVNFATSLLSNLKLQCLMNRTMMIRELSKINKVIDNMDGYRLQISHDYEDEKCYIREMMKK